MSEEQRKHQHKVLGIAVGLLLVVGVITSLTKKVPETPRVHESTRADEFRPISTPESPPLHRPDPQYLTLNGQYLACATREQLTDALQSDENALPAGCFMPSKGMSILNILEGGSSVWRVQVKLGGRAVGVYVPIEAVERK